MLLSWDAFLTRYAPMARAIARHIVRPPATAEDVLQEAALALHRALSEEPDRFACPEHARNYYLRSVHNLALKSQRRAGREGPLEHEPPAVDADDPAARAVVERQEELARLLSELDPESRELIARRYLEHRTLAEISASTGVPVSTLHEREKALLARLRRRLTALDQEVAG